MCMVCDEPLKPNLICNGYGECMNPNTFQKLFNYDCSNNCVPIKCSNKYCNNWAPRQYIQLSKFRKNVCTNCDVAAMVYDNENKNGTFIYLDVPFSKKNEIKRLGAKFDFRVYKKWFIKSDHRNKDEILSQFKEWKCPY